MATPMPGSPPPRGKLLRVSPYGLHPPRLAAHLWTYTTSWDINLKWGHIVYFLNGPVLLIRGEPTRVLLGLGRGKRLRHIEPRLKPGGKYEMATLELVEGTPLLQATVAHLAREAATLNGLLGNPAQPSGPSGTGAA
ncbi:MAG TPA: DUF1801 domain-containing protein [Anaerolineae bacterium]|nr:DUF1801 domain-containing protein [Anaerolineae bacterium]